MSGTLQQKQEIINALENYVFHNVPLKESADRLGISKQLLAFRIDKLSPIVQKEIRDHLYDLFEANSSSYNDVEKIKIKRKIFGWSQQKLTDKINATWGELGISKSTIAAIESGRLKLSKKYKRHIFYVLGLSKITN